MAYRVLNPNISIGSAVLRSSWQGVPILYNGPPFPLKITNVTSGGGGRGSCGPDPQRRSAALVEILQIQCLCQSSMGPSTLTATKTPLNFWTPKTKIPGAASDRNPMHGIENSA